MRRSQLLSTFRARTKWAPASPSTREKPSQAARCTHLWAIGGDRECRYSMPAGLGNTHRGGAGCLRRIRVHQHVLPFLPSPCSHCHIAIFFAPFAASSAIDSRRTQERRLAIAGDARPARSKWSSEHFAQYWKPKEMGG